jgi:hypothetical protein
MARELALSYNLENLTHPGIKESPQGAEVCSNSAAEGGPSS